MPGPGGPLALAQPIRDEAAVQLHSGGCGGCKSREGTDLSAHTCLGYFKPIRDLT